MNEIQADLLLEVEAFCRDVGMAETTFGRLAVNDGKLVDRLRNNTITTNTVEKIFLFMKERRLEKLRSGMKSNENISS